MKKSLKQVVFDFDNTLIRTEVIKTILHKAAMGIYGYSPEQAEKCYQEARLKGGKAAFTMEHYQEVLRRHMPLDRHLSHEQMEDIKDQIAGLGEQILVPGAPEFLQDMSMRNTDRYLLSLGEPTWQQQKLLWSKLGDYFSPDRIFYTADPKVGKSEALKKWFGQEFRGGDTVLFNDKPDETAQIMRDFPELQTYVRHDTDDRRYNDLDFYRLKKEFSDRVVYSKDFQELADHFRDAYWSEPEESRREFFQK